MDTIAFFSLSGAPGVTTTVCALATTAARALGAPVVVEAAAAGGVLAARLGLGPNPGLVSLATDPQLADPAVAGGGLWERHTQETPTGLVLCAGPPGALPAAAALGALAETGLPSSGRDVLLDLGRLDPAVAQSPGWRLAATAGRVLLLAAADAEQIAHVRDATAWLRDRFPGLAVVLVAGGDCRTGEAAAALELPVAAVLPHDPRGAGRLAKLRPLPAPGRSPLLRAADRLARTLTTTPAGQDEPAGPRMLARLVRSRP